MSQRDFHLISEYLGVQQNKALIRFASGGDKSWPEATPPIVNDQLKFHLIFHNHLWERTSTSYIRPELMSKAVESHLAAIF